MSLEKLITNFLIPINIGILAILYVFAFTLYTNLLKDLHEFVDKEPVQRDEKKGDLYYRKVEDAFKTGSIVLHLAFLWSLFSVFDGIIAIKLLSLEAGKHLGWLTCIRISWGLLWVISLALIVGSFKRKDYGLLFALILIIPSSFMAWKMFSFNNCINSLFNAFLWMTFGLLFYCATWLGTILKYTPLVSLQNLRKKFLDQDE